MDNQNVRVLLCEDDENLGMLLKEYLQAKGYVPTLCYDGEQGQKEFHKNTYDICILDVMMPRIDGFTLAQDIRAAVPDMPLIFLTARGTSADISEGYKLGADHYITKPFSMEELVFRMEAVLRRAKGRRSRENVVFNIGKYVFDSQKQVLTYDGGEQRKLTTKETELLTLLAQNANEVLQREYALKNIWMDDNYFNARSMDVYITKLRKLLAQDKEVEIINIHGKGYKLICPEE